MFTNHAVECHLRKRGNRKSIYTSPVQKLHGSFMSRKGVIRMDCSKCYDMGYAVCEGCDKELISLVEKRLRYARRAERRKLKGGK